MSSTTGIAARFDALATGMQKAIDGKMSPACGDQRPTRRRQEQAASMREDGRRMQCVQVALRALAWMHRNGTPASVTQSCMSLYSLTTKGQIEQTLLHTSHYSQPEAQDAQKALVALIAAYESQSTEGQANAQALAQAKAAADLRALETALIGRKIPGYFPTPAMLAEHVVSQADIRPGMRVLEPSAGKGSLCEAIRAYSPGELVCVEPHSDLRTILTAKGYELASARTIEEYHGQAPALFDRIVMNPPFENGQDRDHVRLCYDLLAPGGRLVAIMSTGPFNRSYAADAEFRAWFATHKGKHELLPAGSFLHSDNSTGVNTCVVIIDKAPTSAAQAPKQPLPPHDTTTTQKGNEYMPKLKEPLPPGVTADTLEAKARAILRGMAERGNIPAELARGRAVDCLRVSDFISIIQTEAITGDQFARMRAARDASQSQSASAAETTRPRRAVDEYAARDTAAKAAKEGNPAVNMPEIRPSATRPSHLTTAVDISNRAPDGTKARGTWRANLLAFKEATTGSEKYHWYDGKSKLWYTTQALACECESRGYVTIIKDPSDPTIARTQPEPDEETTAAPMLTDNDSSLSMTADTLTLEGGLPSAQDCATLSAEDIDALFNALEAEDPQPTPPTQPGDSADIDAMLAFGDAIKQFGPVAMAYKIRRDARKARRADAHMARREHEHAQQAEAARAASIAKAEEARAAAQAARAQASATALPGMSIPTLDPTFISDPDSMALFNALLYQAETRGHAMNVLNTGPAGCGKTRSAEQFAAYAGLPLLQIETYLYREARDLFGSRQASKEEGTYFDASLFTRAIEAGNCVVVLEEITRASAQTLNALLPLLDHRRASYVEELKRSVAVGPNCFFFATANIGAEYTGANKRVDLALDTRFGIRLESAYLDQSAEANMLKMRYAIKDAPPCLPYDPTTSAFKPHGMDTTACERIAEFAAQVRTQSLGSMLTESISTRVVIDAADLYELIGARAFRYTILPRFSADNIGAGSERQQVELMLAGLFGSEM